MSIIVGWTMHYLLVLSSCKLWKFQKLVVLRGAKKLTRGDDQGFAEVPTTATPRGTYEKEWCELGEPSPSCVPNRRTQQDPLLELRDFVRVNLQGLATPCKMRG